MFKRFTCILVLILTVVSLASCNVNGGESTDVTTNNDKVTSGHTDDTEKITGEHTDGTEDTTDENAVDSSNQGSQNIFPPPLYEDQYLLSDTLMFKISKNYLSTCFYEFEYEEEVPFEKIVNYYTFEGCFVFDERTYSEEAYEYYDEETATFTVPAEVVHEFICERFNTKPAPEKVECYDKETDNYVFNCHTGTYHFDPKIVKKEFLGNNVYDFAVDLTYSRDETEKTGYICSYTVELTDTGYKYLACKIEEKAVE